MNPIYDFFIWIFTTPPTTLQRQICAQLDIARGNIIGFFVACGNGPFCDGKYHRVCPASILRWERDDGGSICAAAAWLVPLSVMCCAVLGGGKWCAFPTRKIIGNHFSYVALCIWRECVCVCVCVTVACVFIFRALCGARSWISKRWSTLLLSGPTQLEMYMFIYYLWVAVTDARTEWRIRRNMCNTLLMYEYTYHIREGFSGFATPAQSGQQ